MGSTINAARLAKITPPRLRKDDQASAVARAYQRCRTALLRRFGTMPSPATERIWRESAASRTASHTAGYAAAAYAAST